MQSNNINKYIQNKLRVISKKNQLRKLIDVKRMPKNKVTYDNKRVISFSCNDYLSLSLNKKVIEASKNALQSFGVGAGASRLVTGNSFLNSILEDKIPTTATLGNYYPKMEPANDAITACETRRTSSQSVQPGQGP